MLGAIEKLIKDKIEELGKKFTLVDFGSGMGEPSLFFGGKYPNSSIVGYEINKIKVRESSKVASLLEYNNIQFNVQDLSDEKFTPIAADFYYFWNPLYPPVLKPLVEKLKAVYDAGKDFIIITNQVRPFGTLKVGRHLLRALLNSDISTTFLDTNGPRRSCCKTVTG